MHVEVCSRSFLLLVSAEFVKAVTDFKTDIIPANITCFVYTVE